jgi:hypothetical protein
MFLGMTTMIYTHVMNRPGVVARSPLDGPGGGSAFDGRGLFGQTAGAA